MSQLGDDASLLPKSDAVFGKSKSNLKSEGEALRLLLSDRRFQIPDSATKTRLLRYMNAPPHCTHRTYDAIMTPAPHEAVTSENLRSVLADVTLIEVKATKKPIRNVALNGFFFGATEREYLLAEALGDRFRFAFVVLSSMNDYGRPFFVLLTLDKLKRLTRTIRTQFQVNLGSNNDAEGLVAEFGTVEAVIESDPTSG